MGGIGNRRRRPARVPVLTLARFPNYPGRLPQHMRLRDPTFGSFRTGGQGKRYKICSLTEWIGLFAASPTNNIGRGPYESETIAGRGCGFWAACFSFRGGG